MVFEGLQARITADSDDYQTSVGVARELTEALGDEALDVGLSMAVMSNRTDEAEDEVSQLGRSAVGAVPGLSALSASAGRTSVSMFGLNTSVSLSATTLLSFSAAAAVAVTAVVSLVAAIGSLIAVTGLLAAAGLLAFGQQAASRFEDAESAAEGLAAVAGRLKQRVLPILTRLGRAFAPLIQSAVRGLPQLLRSIVNAIGPLQTFTGALRSLGGGLQRLLPLIARLGADAFRKLRPELARLGQAIIRATPQLIRFGTGLLQVLIPALALAFDGMRLLITAFETYGRAIFAVISGMVSFGQTIIAFMKNPVDRTIESIDRLNDRLSALLRKAAQFSSIMGLPFSGALRSASASVAASRSATQNARPDAPTTSTGGRRDDFVSRDSQRSPRGADPDSGQTQVVVRGDTEVVEEVAIEGGRQGAREQLSEEQRRVGDR